MKDYYVGDSDIEGKGLFATRDFKKGDRLRIASGRTVESKVYSDEEFEKFIKWCKDNGKQWDAVALGNGKHRAVVSDRDNHPENYGNHSCEPNLDKNLVALRDIKSGEELTVDYAQFSSASWRMKCSCGAKRCSGIVKGKVR